MSKHPHPDEQPAPGVDDLERNPGIGQSPGLDRSTGLDEDAGEATVEGDIENDVEADGSIDPGHRGRDH